MASTGYVSFDFVVLEDIYPALAQCVVGSQGRLKVEAHLATLRSLAEELEVTEHALRNAEYLAKGFEDLVILLTEPSDKEEYALYEEISWDKDDPYPCAVQLLDQALQFAFKGQRNVENTIVLDVRPLRSRKAADLEDDKTRRQNDEHAYAALRKMLSLLRPKVLVICHCDKRVIKKDAMPEYLCSSVGSAGESAFLKMEGGHKCIKISSFHPMYFARTKKEEPLQRAVRKHLFDASIIVAANALAGRTVCGLGIADLRRCDVRGPYLSPIPCCENDIASPELLKRLEKLGLGSSRVSVNLSGRAKRNC